MGFAAVCVISSSSLEKSCKLDVLDFSGKNIVPPSEAQMCKKRKAVEWSQQACTARKKEMPINRNHDLVFETTHENLKAASKTMIHREPSAKFIGSSQIYRGIIICCK
jgi:hypothetical protein